MGSIYALVAAGVIVLGALGYGAFEHQRYLRSDAQFTSYKAQAEAESAKLRAKAAEVTERVVTVYKDRIREIRVPTPVEVVREIEVIRASGCVLPPAFRVLHDRASGGESETPAGADAAAPVPCDIAAETIRENYARSAENAAQLKALQEWAASVSQ